jgi:dimethylglycine catabolism B
VALLQLPLLEPHRAALEKCVYCPKLSRAACPVSNVEANETVTPWGKMSMAYFVARGDAPIDAAHAEPAWACTGCFGCRERCNHKNEVATTLNDARADLFERDVGPAAAREVAARWAARSEEAARALEEIERREGEGEVKSAQATGCAVLVGCGYARHAPEVAGDALRAVRALTGRAVRAVRACCGLPLLYAGDRQGFLEAARRFSAEVAEHRSLVAVDPGCARALLVEYPRVGVEVTRAEIFVDLALRELGRLQRVPLERTPVRYHDPCQLGRGLDRYDEPRSILARITGAPPQEFIRSRAYADCSGAGGILPATRPASSRAIGEARVAEHRALGGGTLVTACAQSLRRFRSAGESPVDLVSLVARAAASR